MMKILNQSTSNTYYKNNKNISNNPNFKALSPQALKQIKTATSTSASKDIFVKLAGLAGLASLIAWVKTLTNNGSTEVNEKLSQLNSNWSQKGGELFLTPEKQGEYLNLVSQSDSTESLMWTKGLLSKDSVAIDSKEFSKEEVEMFLSPESNDTYLSVLANNAVNSLTNQLKALLNASEDVGASALKLIESKLNSLVKMANELQNSEASAEVYAKVANIMKMFALTNIISTNTIDKNDIVNPSVTEEVVESKLEDSAVNPETSVGDTVIGNQSPSSGVILPQEPVVLGKINLPKDSTRRFRAENPASKQSAVTTPIELKPLPISAENKEFIEEVFKPAFNRTARVDCRIYSDYVDVIKNIYESYPEEKKVLRTQLLKRLKLDDLTSFLDSYSKFTENKKINTIDFLCFVDLELVKRANDGTLSKEDFDKLTELRESTVKFYRLTGGVDQKITIAFQSETTFDIRLDALKEFHKIIYNIPEENLFPDNSEQLITTETVTEELIGKIINNIDDYRNVIAFLDIDVTDVESELNNGSKEEAKLVAIEILNRPQAKKNIERLVELVSNKAFDGIAGGIHARMRFLERMVFNNPTNLSKCTYDLKKITSKAMLDLKKQIEKSGSADLINYPARRKGASLENRLFGPRVFFKDYTIGLNGSAKVHTIF